MLPSPAQAITKMKTRKAANFIISIELFKSIWFLNAPCNNRSA